MSQLFITANRLTDGIVVYRMKDGGWSHDFAKAASFSAEAAADLLAQIQSQETTLVVGAYSAEFATILDLPASRRERIRAFGPSIANADLGENPRRPLIDQLA